MISTGNRLKKLLENMVEAFPGAVFVFDTVSMKEVRQGQGHVKETEKETKLKFYLDDAGKEFPLYSEKRTEIVQKSYLEGYKAPKMRCSLLTKLYVRSKRKKSYIVRLRFAPEQEEAQK